MIKLKLMIKRIILFISIFQTILTFGQIEITGNFYRLDSVLTEEEWLIKGDKLLYTEISKDWSTIWFAVFPIELIQENDSLPDNMRFQFTNQDSIIFSDTKLVKQTDFYETELRFTKQFDGKGKAVLTKKVRIKLLDKRRIMVDDKYFKLDDKLEIFKTFTGY